MKKTVLLFLFTIIIFSCKSAPVLVPLSTGRAINYNGPNTLLLSDWGYIPDDSTEILQKALDSEFSTIIIPAMSGPWVTKPLFLKRDNLTIILEPGALLVAKRDEFYGRGDSLLTLDAVKNITIQGYGATFKMWREDYDKKPYTHAEWRTGIDIISCDNILIEGLTIQDTGGDGIYIGQKKDEGYPTYSSNIIIKNMRLLRNYRQGISVISVKNLLIDNCYIYGTKGTLPQAGIDFEPNRAIENLINCRVTNSQIQNNKGAGILIWLKSLDKTSEPVDITIENCVVNQNGWGLGIYLGGLKGEPGGTLTLSNNKLGFINPLPNKSITVNKISD